MKTEIIERQTFVTGPGVMGEALVKGGINVGELNEEDQRAANRARIDAENAKKIIDPWTGGLRDPGEINEKGKGKNGKGGRGIGRRFSINP